MSRSHWLAGILALALTGCSSAPVKVVSLDYEERLRAAAGQPAERAKIGLAYADLLTSMDNSSAEGGGAERRERAKELYEIALADRETHAVAANNLAALRLDEGEPNRAKELLESIAEEMKGHPDGLPSFYFNLGLARERTGQNTASLEAYLEAVRLDGSMKSASAAASRLIADLPADVRSQKIGDLAGLLAQGGQIEEGERLLKEELERPGDGTLPESLLPQVARFFAATRLHPAELRTAWKPFLEGLMPKFEGEGRSQLETLVQQLDGTSAALAAPAPSGGSPQVPESLASWTRTAYDRRAFSEMLRTFGGVQVLEGETAEGVRRQDLAWRVDPSNSEAAVDLAATVQEKRPIDSSKALLADLLRQAPSSPQGVAQDDKEPTLRLQAALGEICFERGSFGPAEKPGTALFHWLAAVDFYRSLAAADPAIEPMPILFERVGAAYVAAGETPKAFKYYHEALIGYEILGYTELARELAQRINALEGKPQPWFGLWIEHLHIERLVSAPPKIPIVHPPVIQDSQPRAADREIFFEFDRSKPLSPAPSILAEVADLAKKSGWQIEIRIEGHTDSTGTGDYNRDLGLRRATVVWNELARLGIPADKVWISSYGAPASKETTEKEKEKNRRVVLRLSQ